MAASTKAPDSRRASGAARGVRFNTPLRPRRAAQRRSRAFVNVAYSQRSITTLVSVKN
jgi:hypothetical protein